MNSKGQMKRKALILMLAVAMIIAMMPTVAFADTLAGEERTDADKIVNLSEVIEGDLITVEGSTIYFNVPEDDGYIYVGTYMPAANASVAGEMGRVNNPIVDVTQITIANAGETVTAQSQLTENDLYLSTHAAYQIPGFPCYAETPGTYEYVAIIYRVDPDKYVNKDYDSAYDNPYFGITEEDGLSSVELASFKSAYLYAIQGVYAEAVTVTITEGGYGESPEEPDYDLDEDEDGDGDGSDTTVTTTIDLSNGELKVGDLVPVGTVLLMGAKDTVFLDDYISYVHVMNQTLHSKLTANNPGYSGYYFLMEGEHEFEMKSAFDIPDSVDPDNPEKPLQISTEEGWLCCCIREYKMGKNTAREYQFISPDNIVEKELEAEADETLGLERSDFVLTFDQEEYSVKSGETIQTSASIANQEATPNVTYRLVGDYDVGTEIDASTGKLTCSSAERNDFLYVMASVSCNTDYGTDLHVKSTAVKVINIIDEITADITWDNIPSLKEGDDVPAAGGSDDGMSAEPYLSVQAKDYPGINYSYYWVVKSSDGEWERAETINSTSEYALAVEMKLPVEGNYNFAAPEDMYITSTSTTAGINGNATNDETSMTIIVELGTLEDIQNKKTPETPETPANPPSDYVPVITPAPAPTIAVPVKGEDNTVHVDAQVSDSTATINPIEQDELDHVADGTNAKTNIEIDLTGLGTEINSAAIPKETLEKVASTIEKEENVEGLTIKLSTATVEIDSATLAAVIEQADGKEIKLNVDDAGTTRLNEVQKDSVKELEVHLGLEAYFTCNGQRIGDFKGGNVVLRIPFEIPKGYEPDGFSVWYVSDDGEATKYDSTYDAETGELVFVVNHFSDYLVAYDEADVETAAKQAKIDAIADFKLVARSRIAKAKGKKSVRVHWYDQNGKDLSEFGFDGYEVYRSEKRFSGYGTEPYFETTNEFYHNTLIENGHKYYYKVRAYIIVDGEKYYTDWSLKAWRTVK